MSPFISHWNSLLSIGFIYGLGIMDYYRIEMVKSNQLFMLIIKLIFNLIGAQLPLQFLD